MLNYSHPNPVDTPLKNLLDQFQNHQENIKDLLTMRKNCEKLWTSNSRMTN